MSSSRLALPLRVESRGNGPPIVFLHGFGASSFTFRHWASDLSRDHEVVLVDLKGFGTAPKPDDERYGPDDLADLVHRLLVQRDLRDLVVVGHSLGGAVALLTAIRLLDTDAMGRLRGLVTVAGAAYPQGLPPFVSHARRPLVGRLLLRMLPTDWIIRSVLRAVVYDPEEITPAQVDAYAEPLRSSEGRRALLRAARHILPEDADRLVARYPEIDVPALVVAGRDDPVIPPWVAERLVRDLPRARLVVLDECGHIPPEEKPRESLEAVRSFLEELETSGSLGAGPPS